MNQVQIIGRLTRDPYMSHSTSGMAIARFNVAVDTGFGEKKRTDFPSIVVFGKAAETCGLYIKKGSLVGITGRIQTGSYEKNGQTIYTTDIVADRVQFLDRRDGADGSSKDSYGGFASPTQDMASPKYDESIPKPTVDPTTAIPDNFEAIEEDVPF